MIEFLIFGPIMLGLWLMGLGSIVLILVILWRLIND